jgi:hypothetical protein
MTTVINLFGGPGTGKSTLATNLFYIMKSKDINVELVREYVKSWAYNNREPKEYDLIYLLGKQSSYETQLYGKVDYVVTDSPFLLAGIYQTHLSDGKYSYVTDAAKELMHHAETNGIVYKNFYIVRSFSYNSSGRFETEDQARTIDDRILQTLEQFKIPVTQINPSCWEILNHLNL